MAKISGGPRSWERQGDPSLGPLEGARLLASRAERDSPAVTLSPPVCPSIGPSVHGPSLGPLQVTALLQVGSHSPGSPGLTGVSDQLDPHAGGVSGARRYLPSGHLCSSTCLSSANGGSSWHDHPFGIHVPPFSPGEPQLRAKEHETECAGL